MQWKDVSSTSVLVTSCSNSYSSVWGSIEFKIGALSMLYLSVSQYDRRLGPADWWSVWPGRFYSKSWTQWMARIWLRGLEQWELPEWICRNNVWVWPHTKLYHDEGEVRDQKSWNSPWLFSSTHLTGWLFPRSGPLQQHVLETRQSLPSGGLLLPLWLGLGGHATLLQPSGGWEESDCPLRHRQPG